MYSVIVVEDEITIRRGFIKSVDWDRFGCSVVGQSSNGQDGLAMIRDLRPQIVFTDIKMPVMNGLEMLSIAKKEYDFEAVVLSGYGEFAYAKKAITIGVSDFLLKPFDQSEIDKSLSQIVGRLNFKSQTRKAGSFVFERPIPLEASHYTRRGYDYLIQNYHNKIAGSDIANYLEISPGYFYKLFKDDMGVSIHSFILELRLSSASELLLNSPNLKVYEIADMVGFSDYKCFHRSFTAYFGVSPQKYRSSMITNTKEKK